jgi:soluble lytic murein transglycosylase-like protein
MPSKAIIDIDVNSEPFKRFQKLFEQYSKDVRAVNAEWKALAANSNDALAPLADYANAASKAHQRLAIAIGGVGHAMAGVAKSGLGFLHTVEKITANITKWSAISAGIGFFGLDKLAESVFEKGKSAAGAGVTVGQQSAFRVNMGQVLGSPDSVLGNVANAQQDMSKWWALSAMGVNPLAAQNQSPFGLSLNLASRARDIWKQHPNLQYAEARGLTQFFSPEDLRRMGAMSDKDFAAREAGARRDVTALSFGAQQQSAWTKLAIQMQRAGAEIERVLVNGLAKLAPDLNKLSQAVVHLIDQFFKSDEAKKAINELASGIGWLGDELTKPEFAAGIREFVDGIERMARAIAAALKWLAGGGSAENQPAWKEAAEKKLAMIGTARNAGQNAEANQLAQQFAKDYPNTAANIWAQRPDLAKKLGLPFNEYTSPIGPGLLPGDLAQKMSLSEKANGLPKGLLQRIAYTESSDNPYAVSKAGALGLMQFMPGTAAGMGINPFDPDQSVMAAGGMYGRLMAKYGGDLSKAAAAYNWGEGNLDKDIARYGAGWRSHLPDETQQYLGKLGVGGGGEATDLLRKQYRLMKNKNATQQANITIHNNTASQIAIQANNLVPI